MKLFGKMKIYIRKYIRKYIPVLCTLFLIPCISFNAFAFTIPLSSVVVKNDAGIVMDFYYRTSQGVNSTIQCQYDPGEFATEFHTSGVNSSVNRIGFGVVNSFTYSFNHDAYDYYIAFNVFFNNTSSYFNSNNGFVRCIVDGNLVDFYLTDFNYNMTDVYSDSVYRKVFSCIGKIPADIGNHSIYSFLTVGNGYLADSSYNEFTSYLYQVPKGTDVETVNSLISAINNQTSELGGKIDDTNDLIENGSSGTQSVITDFNDVFEDFNEELENWEQFDDEIIGEFNSANEDYKTELNNFSLSGSLLNAGNWLSTSMQTVYDNSSDYKMLWLVPLLFGIPILLFIIRKNGDD